MKVREIMSKPVIRIHEQEPVAVAARTLASYNIGAMPVCSREGRLRGFVTDRDMVTRCLAAGLDPERTTVGQVMTAQVLSVAPDTELSQAVSLMARRQVRRLPVVENDRLCGMLTLADVAGNEDSAPDAADALARITGNLTCF